MISVTIAKEEENTQNVKYYVCLIRRWQAHSEYVTD